MPKRPLTSQEGSSLIELVVGGAIALVVLGAIVGLQISAYRYQRADESRFEVQMEAANGLERIAQEVRSASRVAPSGSGCDGSLALTVDGRTIQYTRDADSQVIRTEQGEPRVIGRRVDCLTFRQRPGGAVEIEWTGAPEGGTSFTLRSKAFPRLTSATAN